MDASAYAVALYKMVPIAMHNDKQLSRYFISGQLGFYASLILCILLRPQGLYANEGISYFSAQSLTILPYCAGMLAMAWFAWRIADKLAAEGLDKLQRWFRLMAALIVCVVLVPFTFNDAIRTLHTWLSSALFLTELAFLFRLAFKLKPDKTNKTFLALSVGAIIVTLSYLNPTKGYLIAGELLFQAIFGIAVFRFLKTLLPSRPPVVYPSAGAEGGDASRTAAAGQGAGGEQGFTIVELMIALSVLSTLLLMSTVLLMNIGAMYNKGVHMASIQNTGRNIVQDVSAALEFSNQQPVYNPGYPAAYTNYTVSGKIVPEYSFCLDTKRYTYILNQQVVTSPDYTLTPPQTYHAMWVDTMKSNASCIPMNLTQSTPQNPPGGLADSTGDGRELIPAKSRLSAFSAQESPAGSGIYDISVIMAYGDNDLLNAGGTRCNGSKGQEYCATTNLSTVVTRRLK